MALIDYYITGDVVNVSMSNTRWAAQTFTASVAYDIKSVKLKLWRDSVLAPGTITVSIRATDVGGEPTGSDLDGVTGTINGDDLPTLAANAEWREITLTNAISLSEGDKYAIVVRCSGTGSYPLYWRSDNDSPTYTGGNYCWSSTSGVGWGTIAGSDSMFETHTAAAYVDLAGTIAGVGSGGGGLDILVDLTGTITGVGAGSGILDVRTFIELAGTIAGVGGGSGDLITQGYPSETVSYKRLVAIGNNQVWYENI